ncbi:MAG: hypothetical protein Q8M64_16410, partial [Methyloversatilis sp.]|nr:hypothetical protein [Methyloversatilis sp.]
MATGKGVIQGYTGVAAVDAARQIVVDAQAHGALGPAPLVRVGREPVADLRCFAGEPFAGACRACLVVVTAREIA